MLVERWIVRFVELRRRQLHHRGLQFVTECAVLEDSGPLDVRREGAVWLDWIDPGGCAAGDIAVQRKTGREGVQEYCVVRKECSSLVPQCGHCAHCSS